MHDMVGWLILGAAAIEALLIIFGLQFVLWPSR
jgi:hypothetical protein